MRAARFQSISPFSAFLFLPKRARHPGASATHARLQIAGVVMSRLFRRKAAEKGEIA
jgi:hypothetical protein